MMPGGFDSRQPISSVREAMQPRSVRSDQALRSSRAHSANVPPAIPLDDLPDELADGLSPSKKKKKPVEKKKRGKTQMPDFPSEVMDEGGAFWKTGKLLGQVSDDSVSTSLLDRCSSTLATQPLAGRFRQSARHDRHAGRT